MKEFSDLTNQLTELMAQEYAAVNEHNPVIQILPKTGFVSMLHVLRQYSIFPREIVSFMESARSKASEAGWLDVARELEENIAEELGNHTQGISHHMLLVQGLEAALAVGIQGVLPSSATARLIRGMQSVFNQETAYTLGAIYAIEATSIPELQLVTQMINHVLEEDMPQSLQYFFDMHLNEWEPEHEADLRTSLEKYLKFEQFGTFSAGFRATMGLLDLWWQDLAGEIGQQKHSPQVSSFNYRSQTQEHEHIYQQS